MTTLKANNDLHRLGLTYHHAIPNGAIDAILESHGLRPLEEGIYCGRDGRVIEEVGNNVWLTLNWHKMDVSGRYEIVAYLSKGPRS